MHTILGAGGAIAVPLAKELSAHQQSPIRLVSRNPKAVNPGDQLMAADLTKRDDVFKAIAGSSVCYVTVGFAYDLKTWKALWPSLIRNVIDACVEHQCKLVFFDNIYAIGKPYLNPITEEAPLSPCSKKGMVRAEVDQLIMDRFNSDTLDAMIVRAPDFFGPIKHTSMLMIMAYDNMMKGKKAQWLSNADVKHSMGYAPELAKGVRMLALESDTWNRIWNLPVDAQAPTAREWVKMLDEELHTNTKIQVVSSTLMKMLGIFIPIMKELEDMSYQFAVDYVFDSSKFNKRFNYTPISNREAIRQTIQALKS